MDLHKGFIKESIKIHTIENSSNKALIIFIKNAEKGKVKTRLAKTLGDDQALKIYHALVKHTREIALEVDAQRHVFYSKHIEYNDEWSAVNFSKHVQHGKDLGQRIEQAFSATLEQRDKAIIIGSDCASLNPAIIEQAFQQLEEVPFVIGPAMDGGYYLLGMNHYSPSLFEDINWSTDTVCSETIRKIKQLGQAYALLEPLSDIDNEEDWKKYGFEIND